VSSETVAGSIISEAKVAARSIDSEALDRQKSILIKNINHQLQDENFYDQHVNEYKIFATVQSLINSWRSKDTNLQRLAEYEDQLVNWLMVHKDEAPQQFVNENTVGTNRLILKVMMKKLSEKYDGVLTPDQKSLIKAYAFSTASEDQSTIIKKMNEVKEKLVESIDSYVTSEDSSVYLHDRLKNIREKLNEGVTKIDDSTVSEYMLYAKLVEELTSGGSDA
jgi:exonuclease VII small subunit